MYGLAQIKDRGAFLRGVMLTGFSEDEPRVVLLSGSWERKDGEGISKGETSQKKVKDWIFKFHAGKYSVLGKTDDFSYILRVPRIFQMLSSN